MQWRAQGLPSHRWSVELVTGKVSEHIQKLRWENHRSEISRKPYIPYINIYIYICYIYIYLNYYIYIFLCLWLQNGQSWIGYTATFSQQQSLLGCNLWVLGWRDVFSLSPKTGTAPWNLGTLEPLQLLAIMFRKVTRQMTDTLQHITF